MTNLPAASGSAPTDDMQAATAQPKTPKAPKAPKPQGAPGRASSCLGAFLNLLTLLFVAATCLSGGLVAVLFRYPDVLTPTVTSTPAPGTPSQEPSATLAVPTYTATWTATPTPFAKKPSPTPTKTGPTPKPTNTRSVFAFNLQPGSPTYLSNFLNTSGCNWFGIVGRAFGLDSTPVINLTVHLEGGGISADVVTGSGPSALGPGGYQIPIADHPIDTTDTYHIQLRNNTGTPLSDIYAIRTFGDCAKNTVMVNFTQNH